MHNYCVLLCLCVTLASQVVDQRFEFQKGLLDVDKLGGPVRIGRALDNHSARETEREREREKQQGERERAKVVMRRCAIVYRKEAKTVKRETEGRLT